jgi:hypothetical protein
MKWSKGNADAWLYAAGSGFPGHPPQEANSSNASA